MNEESLSAALFITLLVTILITLFVFHLPENKSEDKPILTDHLIPDLWQLEDTNHTLKAWKWKVDDCMENPLKYNSMMDPGDFLTFKTEIKCNHRLQCENITYNITTITHRGVEISIEDYCKMYFSGKIYHNETICADMERNEPK